MKESELEKKYKKYKEDEEKLKTIEIERKVGISVFAISSLFILGVLSLDVLFVSLCVFVKSLDTQGGASSALATLGGIGMISLNAFLFYRYFQTGENWSWVHTLSKWLENTFENKMDRKILKEQTKERKEFFKLYELLQDEDYRQAYFNSQIKEDNKLKEKILNLEG